MIKKMKQRLNNQKGLTLIELLAVIVILGIIAAIAIPSIGSIIEKSKYDAAKADTIQVLNAAKLYTAANGIPADTTTTPLTNTTGQLKEYIDEVENLKDYSVSFDVNGLPSIVANAKDGITEKDKTPAKFEGTAAEVSKYQYDGGAPGE